MFVSYFVTVWHNNDELGKREDKMRVNQVESSGSFEKEKVTV